MLIKETIKIDNTWKLITRTGEEIVFKFKHLPKEIKIIGL